MKKENNFAFTLAEVLITLGIIGIVAALTLPSVVTNYKKQETISKLKKGYSIIQQTLKMAEIDNGEISNWEPVNNGHEFFVKYIKNYVKASDEYTSNTLWRIAPRKNLNGTAYSGSTYATWGNSISTHFMLPDGILITLNAGSLNNIWVGIDTNGLKKPNQIGKDTFLFIFTSKHGLQPLGGSGTSSGWNYGTYSRKTIIEHNSNGCNLNANGYWCSALIMNDGWEIKKDYPFN